MLLLILCILLRVLGYGALLPFWFRYHLYGEMVALLIVLLFELSCRLFHVNVFFPIVAICDCVISWSYLL